ncbi:nucleotide-binding protein [Ralstonia mannitolilytica]|uniref:TIR domain-containing protein n=1 Tax=Ralstonia mannitolilytica TaxID=105219 RepID=UPI0005D7890A|nr:nucleotide-binding protein [Ralstonia mannitolilytica]AJW45478.1 hypothetical protein TK49_12640 [Ralstonia mannitolilytica]QIF07684.1 nucleotide-binding protein [Ralstonia mannitolilytica]CAJ0783500.1 hypothetical protein R77555_01083 [Ralstonia mannitolilytica]
MNVAMVMAKLSGVRKALDAVLTENVSRNRSQGEVLLRRSYQPDVVQHYFTHAHELISDLRLLLPDLYADFQQTEVEPNTEVVPAGGGPYIKHFGRQQLERLARDIDQVFEIRANTELAQPAVPPSRRVFITHGRAQDWRAVQAYIEKDAKLPTIELAQEPNSGQTIIEKLETGAAKCDSAVIVMTGDDLAEDEVRVRENVMHEIGYFHGRYGRKRVVLLHEDGVHVPTNLAGIAYVPFPKGQVDAGLHVLRRELDTMYGQ